MSNPVVSWAKAHPVAAGGAALGVVVLVLLMSGGSGSQQSDGASGGMGASGLQAYYAAVANQAQAGAAIQTAEIAANAETNKALIAANYGIESAKVWAPVQMAATQSSAANEAARIANEGKTIDYGREISLFQISTQHAIFDNMISLENAKLAQQQNIAFKNANISKPSVFGQIIGAVETLGSAYLTGGASLAVKGINSGVSSTAPATLPGMGSSGNWI